METPEGGSAEVENVEGDVNVEGGEAPASEPADAPAEDGGEGGDGSGDAA